MSENKAMPCEKGATVGFSVEALYFNMGRNGGEPEQEWRNIYRMTGTEATNGIPSEFGYKSALPELFGMLTYAQARAVAWDYIAKLDSMKHGENQGTPVVRIVPYKIIYNAECYKDDQEIEILNGE